MFGGKLKTWMETHIGRQKKKPTADRGSESKIKKVILGSAESLARSDTGISSGSVQVLSSTADGQDGYGTSTIESSRGGPKRERAINLSSPESAYSTGYSTDGDALQPEYYINIRTGKHYFPSPAPTPTSPRAPPLACFTTSFLSAEPRIPPLTSFPSWLAEPDTRPPLPPRNVKTPPKSPLNSLKLFLKSPKQDKVKPKTEFKTLAFENKKSPTKSKKWYKQPFKFTHKSSETEVKQVERKDETQFQEKISLAAAPDKSQVSITNEATASPRQRTRIRTNPWIPTEPAQPHPLHFPATLLRNRSCTNTPLQQRKTPDELPLADHLQQLTARYDSSRDYLSTLERVVSQHMGQKLLMDMSDHSEEDLTLNEVMGTFNESYVYEKETDILSDSDPTDCEDYVSDSEANHGGDEDSHDDELDFIDTASVVDEPRTNNGRCSYHEIQSKNSFLYRNRKPNSLDAENRKNSRKEKEARKRRHEENKRRSLRKIDKEEIAKTDRPSVEVSLRKALLQKIIDRNCSINVDKSPNDFKRKQLSLEKSPLRETHIGPSKSRNKYDLSALADAEADKKYNQLIQEAEIMLESLKNTPVAMKRFESPKNSPSKSPRRLRNSPHKSSPKFERSKETPRRSPKNLGLKLSVGGNSNGKPEEHKSTSFRAKSSAHSPLDPLGPTFRNFSVFKPSPTPKKISSSSSDDSETVISSPPPVPALPFGFQFVDLGRPMTSHCPQSEPVKRKMYTCSQTFDRLVRTFDPPGPGVSSNTPVPAFINPMYSPCPEYTAQINKRRSFKRPSLVT